TPSSASIRAALWPLALQLSTACCLYSSLEFGLTAIGFCNCVSWGSHLIPRYENAVCFKPDGRFSRIRLTGNIRRNAIGASLIARAGQRTQSVFGFGKNRIGHKNTAVRYDCDESREFKYDENFKH